MPKVLTFGKAYRIKKGSRLVGLALPVKGRMRIVRWSKGKLHHHPVESAQAITNEPGVRSLLDKWRLPVEVLNAFVEREVYRRSQDCEKVRAMLSRKVG